MQESIASTTAKNKTINLLEYLKVIAKRSNLIVRVTLATFIIAIIVSLLLPNIYSATAKIIPPQQNAGLMGMMMGQMGGGCQPCQQYPGNGNNF